MQNKITEDTIANVADQAAGKADQAIRSTQRVANEALDNLSSTVHNATDRAVPLVNRATEQAAALAQRGVDAVRNGTHHLREKAAHATDTTSSYIRNDPIKSVLIAAATGAALMGLLSLMSRSRRHD